MPSTTSRGTDKRPAVKTSRSEPRPPPRQHPGVDGGYVVAAARTVSGVRLRRNLVDAAPPPAPTEPRQAAVRLPSREGSPPPPPPPPLGQPPAPPRDAARERGGAARRPGRPGHCFLAAGASAIARRAPAVGGGRHAQGGRVFFEWEGAPLWTRRGRVTSIPVGPGVSVSCNMSGAPRLERYLTRGRPAATKSWKSFVACARGALRHVRALHEEPTVRRGGLAMQAHTVAPFCCVCIVAGSWPGC